MKRKKSITIDLTKWTTPKNKAADMNTRNGKGCTVEYIYNQIRMKKLETWTIEELGITLVEK